MQNAWPAAIAVLVLELAPAVLFGLAGERVWQTLSRWPSSIRTDLASTLRAALGFDFLFVPDVFLEMVRAL